MSAPDALHVGFSKCASTFLQAFFSGHPEIFLVNQSHYLAPFEFSDFEHGRDGYYRLFEAAAPGQVRLESDEHIILPLFHPVLRAAATTLESVEEVCRRITTVQPAAKIILVIRNQVDLIASRYSEYVLGGGKGDFRFFVDEFLCCSSDGVNYYQNYYARIIETLRRSFGAERVLVLLQEELGRDEAETIGRLCRFLEVTVRQPDRRGMASRRVGLSALGLRVMRGINRMLVTRQEMSMQKAKVRVPYLAYKVLQRSIRTADYYSPRWLKGDKRTVLTAGIEQRIRDEFRQDNAELADLLHMDVATLGYR